MADFRRPFRSTPLRKRPANLLQFESRVRRQKNDKRKSWLKANWAFALLIAAPVAGVGVAWISHTNTTQSSSLAEQYQVDFGRCHGPVRINCVVDGDTFWLEGTKYRIADINAPEVSRPGCSAEAALGERATSRLVDLLNSGSFSLQNIDRDEDRYGRKLRIVTRAGRSLGDALVTDGLAERWSGRRRNWC